MADTALHSMTDNSDVGASDEMYVLKNPTTTPADTRAKVSEVLKAVNKLTADTAPSGTADYLLTYDTSVASPKKVLLGAVSSYALQFTSANTDPADSTTYYFSNFVGTGWTTAVGRRRIYIPRAGTITVCYLFVTVGGTLGSAETATVSIRLNDTTDTTVSAAVDFDAAEQVFSKTDLSIAVAQGDWVSVKVACPAWATNPTTVAINGVMLIV